MSERELLLIKRYDTSNAAFRATESTQECRLPEGCVLVDNGQSLRVYREKRAPWNGEGLPPVGTVCEIVADNPHEIFAHHMGAPVRIIAHDIDSEGDTVAVYAWDDGEGCNEYHGLLAECFRPLRTAEQIAADEREAAVAAALSDIERLYSEGGPAAVYDAGYRLQERAE